MAGTKGTGTFSSRIDRVVGSPYFIVAATTITDAAGSCIEDIELHGWLDCVVVDSLEMTTLWDLTLEDDLGNDLLSSAGLNRAVGLVQTFWVRDATTGQKNHYVRLDGVYRFRLINGGASKGGLVTFRLFDLAEVDF